MEKLLLTILVGTVAGVMDILPMIKMKIDKYAISSAFIFYLIMPFIIFNTALLESIWWLKGGLLTFVLALPIIIATSKESKKSVIPITAMSIVLGTLIGIAGHFMGIM